VGLRQLQDMSYEKAASPTMMNVDNFNFPDLSAATMDPKGSAEYNEKVEFEQNITDISDAARQAERKLRLKIDFMVVPTVTLLYLLCFIDRTNIGRYNVPR